MPLVELVDKFKAGDVEWEEVLEFAKTYKLKPRVTMLDVGYHHVEDEFPQPGTLEELAWADLEDDELDELYDLMVPEGERAPNPDEEEPDEDEDEA